MERNVLVTGADSGLGLALCSGLLRQGWHVFAGQYRPDWRELASLAENYPQTLHNVPLDVSPMDSVQSAVQTVGTFTKHPDVLINNAGINSPRKDLTIRAPQDYSEMHRLYDVNSLGPLRMAEAFLPMMELAWYLQTLVLRLFGGRQHWEGRKNELVRLLHVESSSEHGGQDTLQ